MEASRVNHLTRRLHRGVMKYKQHNHFYSSTFTAILAVSLLCALLSMPEHAKAATSYASLERKFETLAADPKKSSLREPWEKLQAEFDLYVKANPAGSNAPKAAYLAARCIEEIAIRTYRASDFKLTATRYGEVGKDYPKTTQGQEALYKKADVEFNKLKNSDSASQTIQQLLKIVSNEELKQKAKKLEAKIKQAGSSSPPQLKAEKAVHSSASPQSAEVFSQPTLISITVNASDKTADGLIELSEGAGYSWRYLPKSKTASGQAVLLIEVEGVVPNKGISGLRSISKGPVRHVNVIKAKVNAEGGKTVSSCRVELTLKDNYACSVTTPGGKPELHLQVDSAKKQTSPSSGRGVAGRIETPTRNRVKPTSASSQPASKAEMLGLTVNTILLDPGHGGKDPGAQANGIQESRLVLKVAKLVETRLKKRGFQVSYTRDKNVFISLEKRTETANRRKADLFVSIHVNANTDTSVAGIETYYLDKARTKSAQRVAARENGVSVASIDDLQVILTDLGLGTKMKESHELAKSTLKSIERQVKSGGFTVRSNGARSAPFYVLMGAKMPAILIEVGYCTNKNDANYLKNDKYLERIADGIVEGIVAYKKRVENSVE